MILPILRAMKVTMTSWSSHLAGHLPLSLIVNFLVTMLVMAGYTRALIVRAFTSYIYCRATDMETLIAPGSISAFSLLLFILGIYHRVCEWDDRHSEHAVLGVKDSLTSASIMFLLVTIGKCFEGRSSGKSSA